MFKDEDALLEGKEDTDKAYVEEVLPLKMKYNLKELNRVGLFHNIKIMFMTVFKVLKNEGNENKGATVEARPEVKAEEKTEEKV